MRLVIDDMNSRLSQEISVVLTGVFELSILNNPGTNPAVPVQLLLVVLGTCISSHFYLPLYLK